MPSSLDTTVQLTGDDLIPMPPSPPTEPTIKLSAADVEVLEAVARVPEVIVRPSDLSPSLRQPLVAALWRAVSAASLVALACGRAVGQTALRGWAAARRGANALRSAAGPTLRRAGRVCVAAMVGVRDLLGRAWAGTCRGGRILWDSTFPLRDWVTLKLRRVGQPTISGRAVALRQIGPADRALVEDLQRALTAYGSDRSDGKLIVMEIDGRVAIMVPNREPKVEVTRPSGEADLTPALSPSTR